VQPVGTGDEVKPTGGGPFERYVDAPAVVGEGHDGVVVDEFCVVVTGAGQNRGEVAARNLQIAGAGLRGDPPDASAPTVNDTQGGRERGGLTQSGQQVHLLDHGQGGAADVNGVSAGPCPCPRSTTVVSIPCRADQ
jgi:hypothetical protein